MNNTRFAAIDIGTNAVQMRIAASNDGRTLRTLVDRNEITGLGRGVDRTKRLSSEGIGRAHASLREGARLAREHHARIVAVGTSALRDAENARDFTIEAERILGAPIEIIDGAREAALTCRGALYDLEMKDACLVDIGGGSTEIIAVRNGEMKDAVSIDIGSVRLYERHIHHDPPSATEIAVLTTTIDDALRASRVPVRAPIVALAGTATSVALLALELDADETTRVHRLALESTRIHEVAARLATMSLAMRQASRSIHADRADVIVAGSAILSRIAHAAENEKVIISDSGVRVGLLVEAFDTPRP